MRRFLKISLISSLVILVCLFLFHSLLIIGFTKYDNLVEILIYTFLVLFTTLFVVFVRFFIKENKNISKLNKYTQNLNQVLVEQSRNRIFYEGKVNLVSQELTRQVTNSLCTDRCSIWIYNKDKTSIICQKLYDKSKDTWFQNDELFEKDFKPYFDVLKIDPVIIANDAENHPSTSCFRDLYLKPLGIKSMLDVPIVFKGEVLGVICIENFKLREWTDIEINFAKLLSSLYSFAHSVREENKQKNKLEEIQKFLDEASLISKADPKGKITYVNKKFIDISGYNLEEAIGKDHNLVNSGVHSKEVWKNMYHTTLQEKKTWHMVVTNKNKNGELYYVDTYIKAEFDSENGELIGFTSIRQDVTELKRKELDIRNRMTAINQSNMVIEFDTLGYIKFANDNFCKSLGYDTDEIVGKHHSIFVSDDFKNSKEYEDFWNQLKQGIYITSQFKRIKKNGESIWLQATYNPIFDNEGKVMRVMKIATNVTDKVLQSLEIEKKNTYLEHAAKILRHDMHSGINTYIPRGVTSLERRLGEDDIKRLNIEAPLKMIKEGLKHTQKVYKGVYEFTNLVKKDKVLTKNESCIRTILEDYLSSTAYKSQVLIDENIPKIYVNDSLFCTAIDNLIRNGLKYNDSATKLVKIYFEDKHLIVEDNGRGIDQTEFEELSKPYVRKLNQKETGTGLGLNICKAILKEHGFEITAEKLKEGGTKLKIKVYD